MPMPVNRTLLQWSRTVHIYLSIALLLVLVFFSVTGITLNHANTMTGEPVVTTRTLDSLPDLPLDEAGMIADSPELAQFLRDEFGLRRSFVTLQGDGDLLVIDYRAPGRSAFVEIDAFAGTANYELTDFGLVAMFNDLHKARDTDVIWKALVDISGVLLVLFSLAGFVLLLPNNYRFKRVSLFSLIGITAISVLYWFAAG